MDNIFKILDFHFTGFSTWGFAVLIIVIAFSYIFETKVLKFHIEYVNNNDLYNKKLRKIFNRINITLNKTTPWLVLVVANVSHFTSIATYILQLCILVNLITICYLALSDYKECKKFDLPQSVFSSLWLRFIPFFLCMSYIIIFIKPLMYKHTKNLS